MSMDKASARERLESAEDKFSDLTQGGRDLVDQQGTRYKFADGSEATGIEAAADRGEQVLRAAERSART